MRIFRIPFFLLMVSLVGFLSLGSTPTMAKKKPPKGEEQARKPSMLDIEDCPEQPGCPAIILLDETVFNNDQFYTGYSRRQVIKLFTQEAVEKYADIQVPAMKGVWSIKNLRGKTVLPDGTEIQLDKENITEKTLKQGKRKVRVKSATFPGVVPGAIIIYGFELELESYTYMTEDEWAIQQPLPVYKAKYILKPGKYDFGWEQAGFEHVEVELTRPTKKDYVFTAMNVPPIPDESYGPYGRAMQARMFFFLPEERSTWLGSLAGFYARFSGNFIEETPGIVGAVQKITSAEDSERDKVLKIYNFVQQEIGTEEQRLTTTQESSLEDAENAGEVLARGYGNEFERTMLFLALVKAAGMEHGLLLIANRYNGPLVREIPDDDIFDSFAASVKMAGRWKTFDPATRHCPFGMISPEKESDITNGILIIPDRSAGQRVQTKIQDLNTTIIQPAPYNLIDIPFSSSKKNYLTREVTLKLEADGSGEIEMSEQGTGQVDLAQRQSYEFLDETERLEKLQDKLKGLVDRFEILEAEFVDFSSFEKQASINCRIKVDGIASSVGDRLIVTPSLFHAGDWNPFITETRKAPVLFLSTRYSTDRILVEVPDGYEIEGLPDRVVVEDPPLFFSADYIPIGNGFRFVRRVNIDTATWPANDYDRLKSFYETLQKTDRQVVILTRSEG